MKYSIQKGDELDVEERGNVVVVSTKKAVATNKMVIKPETHGEFHKNYLSGCYHVGFDEVDIYYDNPKVMDMVKDRIQNCIGFEIVDQRKNFCGIKSVSRVSKEEFDQILRKTFLLLVTTGQNCLEIIEKGEMDRMQEVITLENTNNKLTDFCRRVLWKDGYKDQAKTPLVTRTVTDLERLADHYRDIGKYLLDKDMKISKDTIQLLRDANGIFELFYALFYKFDRATLNKIYAEHDRLDAEIMKLMENCPKGEAMVLHCIANIVSQVYEMSNNLFEITLL
jgi:phosphate uptake regulator